MTRYMLKKGGSAVLSCAVSLTLCVPGAFAYAQQEQTADASAPQAISEKAGDAGDEFVLDAEVGLVEFEGSSAAGEAVVLDEGAAGEDAAEAVAVADGAIASNAESAALSDSTESSAAQADETEAVLAASSATLTSGTYAIVPACSESRVLDVEGASASNMANVRLWQTNGTPAQRWNVTVDQDGWATIVCAGSGKALDVCGAKGENGSDVWQYEANGSSAQRWKIVDAGDGTYELRSALGSNMVLDVEGGIDGNGSNVQLWEANGSSAQRFKFIAANASLVEPGIEVQEGVYTLHSAAGSGFTLDIEGADRANGAAAQLWQENGTLAQAFRVRSCGDGFYTLAAVHSGRMLEVSNGDVVPGARVQQWGADAATLNQKWAFRQNADGTLVLVCAANGLVLDVAGGQAGNGASVRGWQANGTAAQGWTLSPVKTLVADGVYSLKSLAGAGGYVDVAGCSNESGANVQVWSGNGSPAQKFKISNQADGSVVIEALCSGKLLADCGNTVQQISGSASDKACCWIAEPADAGGVMLRNANTGKVLDVAGAGSWDGCDVQTYESNGTAAQAFILQSTPVLNEGIYEIVCTADGRALDVDGASRSAGANVQVWDRNGTGAQAWYVKELGDGWYSIINCRSDKALDVDSWGTEPGTNVQQWHNNGVEAQRWRAEYAGNGGYRFVSACGGLVLDVAGGGGSNGANVQTYTANGTAAQSFHLVPTTYVRQDFEDRIASFTTWSSNTFEGTYNMQRALNCFDGYILWPGQTLSFFGTCGPCGAAEGYMAAGIVGGVGYGGGICQASTTLYGVCIRAGLTIVERQNHSVPSTYVPIGLDAMVNWGTSDFKVRNDYDFPIKFQVNTPGNQLYIEAWGIQPEWFDYCDADSWYTSSNSAAASRTYYKDGRAVRTDSLPSSVYW